MKNTYSILGSRNCTTVIVPTSFIFKYFSNIAILRILIINKELYFYEAIENVENSSGI